MKTTILLLVTFFILNGDSYAGELIVVNDGLDLSGNLAVVRSGANIMYEGVEYEYEDCAVDAGPCGDIGGEFLGVLRTPGGGLQLDIQLTESVLELTAARLANTIINPGGPYPTNRLLQVYFRRVD